MDAAVLNFASLACGCMQSFAKRLYRFMRRAMTRWPEQQPIGPLINLYLAYIAPWSVYTLTSPHQPLPCLYCPPVSLHPHLASSISTLPILPPGQSTPSPCLVLPCQMLLQLTNRRAWGSTSSFYLAFVAFSVIHSLTCVIEFNCKAQHCLHAQPHLCWVVFA